MYIITLRKRNKKIILGGGLAGREAKCLFVFTIRKENIACIGAGQKRGQNGRWKVGQDALSANSSVFAPTILSGERKFDQ
jgi:hypothetical protein